MKNGKGQGVHSVSENEKCTGSTEEEIRQFEAEQVAKRKRRKEYARLNEESALKRKLIEQEGDERYYQTNITKGDFDCGI